MDIAILSFVDKKKTSLHAYIHTYSLNIVTTYLCRPNVEALKKNIQETIHSMEMSYGTTGSLFRSGSRQTFFAAQVVR